MSFYVTGGTLKSDAPSYVEREADRQLYEGLLKGEFCYVLTARQMGKSSLMVRTADRLHAAGIHVVAMDLTALGAQNLTAEQWYYGLLDTLGVELGLQAELEQFWQNNRHLGPLNCFRKSLGQVVLPLLEASADNRDGLPESTQDVASASVQEPKSVNPNPADKGVRTNVRLVIFVDEIDFVRSLPFSTDEFFAAIRECYNHRTIDPAYEWLTFCLLGVASPSDLIRDTRTTPFNIGRRIELHDFTPEEAAPLALGLQDSGVESRAAKRLLERVLFWTNGHPYLTQRLCLATAEMLRAKRADGSSQASVSPTEVDHLCNDLYFCPRARELDDNLVFVRERLLRSDVDVAGLLELYRSIWQGKRVMDDPRDPLIRSLRLSGVVRVTEGRLCERNRIYGRVFAAKWARSNLPKAELRRQHEAYFRGLVRATAVTIAVFLAMAVLIALAVRARHETQAALWKSLYRQAKLNRASELPGQRFEALDSLRQASKIKLSAELADEAIACLAMLDVRRKPARSVPEKSAATLAFSDDLEIYASSNPMGEIVVRRTSDDGELRRWATGTGAQERVWISRDRQYLAAACGGEGGTVLSLWQLPIGKPLFALTNRMQLAAFDFHPDSKQIAVGGEDGFVRVFALPGGETYTDFEVGESCSVLRYDPEGRRLAIGSSDSLKVGVYEVAGGALVRPLHSASPPTSFAWHPNGQILAAACKDRQIRLWEIEADEFAKEELPKQAAETTALSFSRSGDILASAYADQTVRFWDWTRAKPPLTVPDCGDVRQLQFGHDDHGLALAGSGGMLRFMEVASGEVCRTLSDFDAQDLNALDIHPNGRLMATAHSGGITFWDLANSRKLGRMEAGTTVAARFHPQFGDLIDAEFRGTYGFAVEPEERAGRHILALNPKEDFYLGPGAVAVDFAGETDVLAVAYGDRVRLARSTNSAYAVIDELIGEPGFKTVALSPDGSQVAAGNWSSGNVWVWNRSSGGKPHKLPVEGHAYVRFSPNGRWLGTGTERKVTLWDTRTWQAAIPLDRPAGTTHPAPVAFVKGGSLWATAWSDSTVRLLDMHGKPIANLEPPEKEPLVDLTFTPDGSRLACGTSARTVLVWDLDALARGLAQLGLSIDLTNSAAPRPNLPPLILEFGALDRLRFSQPKYVLQKRREIAELTKLISEDPAAWHYYMYRAEKYRQLGEFDKAVKDYQRWIELDGAAGTSRNATDKAWPLRDLALIYLSGPPGVHDYGKAFELTREALNLDPDNADNHFRHGVACYRLGYYDEASGHLQRARGIWEKKSKDKDKDKVVAATLFYEAMCLANKKNLPDASTLLEQAKQTYSRSDSAEARTNWEDRKSLKDQFPDLLWEAERVVEAAGTGG